MRQHARTRYKTNMNELLDNVGVEDHSEDETRFCYLHQHSCANFQSVTLEKVYPSSAIKKAAIFLVHDPNSELISMALLQCDR